MAAARRCLLLTAAFLAAACGDPLAQDRSGLVGGISVGAGAIDLHSTSSDPSVDFVHQGSDSGLGAGMNLYLGGMTGKRARRCSSSWRSRRSGPSPWTATCGWARGG